MFLEYIKKQTKKKKQEQRKTWLSPGTIIYILIGMYWDHERVQQGNSSHPDGNLGEQKLEI